MLQYVPFVSKGTYVFLLIWKTEKLEADETFT